VCITKKKKPKKNLKPLLKLDKAKGPVTLGRSTIIDEILKKSKYQRLVGPRKVVSRHPTSFLQATRLPSIAFAEVHNQTEEQDFQEIENSSPKPLQEGNLNNLYEGRGETWETEEPRSPLGIVQQLTKPR